MAKYIKTKEGKVRIDFIKPEILEAHEYVMAIYDIREKLSKELQAAKEKEKALTGQYLGAKADYAGLQKWDGFASDYNIDSDVRVETRVAEIIAIDTNVSAGIQKIADWVDNLQPNLNKKIKKILKDVLSFKTSGSISKSKLQKLCSYEFDDQEYIDGVQMIMSNMKVIDRKSYTDVLTRQIVEEETDEGPKAITAWTKINVNYAGM